MSTLVTQAPSVYHWLPGAARPIAAACPACGGLDSLVYSLSDAYVACTGCGWQRRLGGIAKSAAAMATIGARPWLPLLATLAQLNPDPLPPVAALLWRRLNATTWEGPSRTTPGARWMVRRTVTGRAWCTCPNRGRSCWHVDRAYDLGLPYQTDAERAACAATATDDLFG